MAFFIVSESYIYLYFETDVDECLEASTCDANANCTNTVGSYNCSCNLGFTGNGSICEGQHKNPKGCKTPVCLSFSSDVDECAESLADCVENAYCKNTIGSYECGCNDGFTGDGFTCDSKLLWL